MAPDRMTFRTVLRETCWSRTMSLIARPRAKNSRRMRAIVSTPFIPLHHPSGRTGEQSARTRLGGQNWTPIPRLTGSKLHAETQKRAVCDID
ncbi:hypothetical protein ASF57_12480 [Methylobacterium sp. Leaf117]|nr:hypothetical protein ASF57_12480 [Methylobacterium sp. Leaf117]